MMRASTFFALAALVATSSAQSITSLDAAQSQAVLSVWSHYSQTVAFDKSVGSLVQAVETAVPASDVAHTTVTTTASMDLVSYLNQPPAISTPSWISDMPKSLATPYMELLTSVENAMVSLGREAAVGAASESTTMATSASSTGSASGASAASVTSATSTGAAAAATVGAFVKVAGLAAAGAVGAVALIL